MKSTIPILMFVFSGIAAMLLVLDSSIFHPQAAPNTNILGQIATNLYIKKCSEIQNTDVADNNDSLYKICRELRSISSDKAANMFHEISFVSNEKDTKGEITLNTDKDNFDIFASSYSKKLSGKCEFRGKCEWHPTEHRFICHSLRKESDPLVYIINRSGEFSFENIALMVRNEEDFVYCSIGGYISGEYKLMVAR